MVDDDDGVKEISSAIEISYLEQEPLSEGGAHLVARIVHMKGSCQVWQLMGLLVVLCALVGVGY